MLRSRHFQFKSGLNLHLNYRTNVRVVTAAMTNIFLKQVRVGNLQELVYKQGQAGVTKATVTIVFDNSDPTTSPVAYESCKQITVTRQVF